MAFFYQDKILGMEIKGSSRLALSSSFLFPHILVSNTLRQCPSAFQVLYPSSVHSDLNAILGFPFR